MRLLSDIIVCFFFFEQSRNFFRWIYFNNITQTRIVFTHIFFWRKMKYRMGFTVCKKLAIVQA